MEYVTDLFTKYWWNRKILSLSHWYSNFKRMGSKEWATRLCNEITYNVKNTNVVCYVLNHNVVLVKATDRECEIAVRMRRLAGDRVQCTRCGKRMWTIYW